MLLYIIGMPGSGKSTLGRYLAKQINHTFIDADNWLEHKCGVSIQWMFEIEGEAGFRERERKALLELSQLQDTVVATGGGVILDPENRRTMQQTGTIVYLQASYETLLARLEKDTSRPLLSGNAADKLRQLLADRTEHYEALSHFTVATHRHAQVRNIASQILTLLKPDNAITSLN